jgi:hypothetical protein
MLSCVTYVLALRRVGEAQKCKHLTTKALLTQYECILVCFLGERYPRITPQIVVDCYVVVTCGQLKVQREHVLTSGMSFLDGEAQHEKFIIVTVFSST